MPYSGAITLVVAAFWVRYAAQGLISGQLPPWITFYPTVMLVSLIYGFRPGLLATATAALAAYYFLFLPEGFVFKGLINTISVTVFTCMGVFISAVAERYRLARYRLAELVAARTADLSRTNEQLTQEVDERKKAEEDAVRASEAWEKTFDSVPDMIAILDERHRIRRVNKAMARRLGRKQEDCTGLLCYEAVHGLSAPPAFCPHAKTMRDGEEHLEEVHEDRLGGKFLISTTPLRDEHGLMIGSVHVGHDISEHKRAEAEMLRLNKALKALSDSSQAVVRAKDEQEYLNEVCGIIVEDCGYSMAWIGFAEYDEAKSVRSAAHAGFEEGYLETLQITWADTERGRGPTGTAIRTGKVAACPNMLTDPAFSPWRQRAINCGYSSSIVFPLRADDKVIGALTIYSKEADPFSEGEVKLLTELADNLSYGIEVLRIRAAQKKVEDALKESEADLLKRNDELEFANKELESFIYSVSHDLRGPLRAISGFSQIVMKDIADKLDEKGRRYLSRIHDGTEKMSRLIDDLLNLSRISRQEMQRREVNLSSIAASIVAELREVHRGRSVEVDIKEGLTANADPGVIEIVLSNLIGNAWKFTAKTEHASIEFGTVEQDGKIIYYVGDNGAGFDQKYAGKMFWPFHRLHSESEFEGTGIGLAIVDRIISRHGGKVWSEGVEGKGATIYFSLP